VTAVLLAGEIIPQAVCSKYGLQVHGSPSQHSHALHCRIAVEGCALSGSSLWRSCDQRARTLSHTLRQTSIQHYTRLMLPPAIVLLHTSSAPPLAVWASSRVQRCGADGADGMTTWQVGAACAPLVRVLMVACSPVALPISKTLDRVLGPSNNSLFQRKELTALVDLETEQVRGAFTR
jgi:hypothetical protein